MVHKYKNSACAFVML